MDDSLPYFIIAWVLIVLLIVGLDEDKKARAEHDNPAIALACGPLPADIMPSDTDGSYGRLLERYEPMLCGDDILFKRREEDGR
jgi:hypothetical protein